MIHSDAIASGPSSQRWLSAITKSRPSSVTSSGMAPALRPTSASVRAPAPRAAVATVNGVGQAAIRIDVAHDHERDVSPEDARHLGQRIDLGTGHVGDIAHGTGHGPVDTGEQHHPLARAGLEDLQGHQASRLGRTMGEHDPLRPGVEHGGHHRLGLACALVQVLGAFGARPSHAQLHLVGLVDSRLRLGRDGSGLVRGQVDAGTGRGEHVAQPANAVEAAGPVAHAAISERVIALIMTRLDRPLSARRS